MRRTHYYAVCYAHVCRWQKADNEQEAARLAFGVSLSERMTVAEFPSNPKYLAVGKRNAFLDYVFAVHLKKTGNEIK